jgi:hypothetical protein
MQSYRKYNINLEQSIMSPVYNHVQQHSAVSDQPKSASTSYDTGHQDDWGRNEILWLRAFGINPPWYTAHNNNVLMSTKLQRTQPRRTCPL